jgi:hypothetical protein
LLPAGATLAGWDCPPLGNRAFTRRTEFDAYLQGGDVGALLRASYKVAGSSIEMDPKRAFAIAELTGSQDKQLVDYDDAGRAVRRWFALMAEPGARH